MCDDDGNVYGTFLPDRIFKYDSKSERVIDLNLKLPSDSNIYPRTVSVYKRYMRVGEWDKINKKIYGVEAGTSILFEFNPQAGKEGGIRVLDRLLPYQDSEKLKKAHYATLSFALGHDRKIYYMPIGSSDLRDSNEGINFFDWVGQAYLITYNLNTYKKDSMGKVFTENGARVIDFLNRSPSGGGTVNPDGTIYFCGFVEEKNPELVSYYFTDIPAGLKLLIYKP